MSRFLRVSLLALLALAAFAPPAPAQSPAGLVIDEIDYDQPTSDTAEFLEIRNNGAAWVNLDTYALRFVNGANGGAADYRTVDLPAVDIGAGAHYVVCGNPATVTECDLDANGAATQDLIQNGEPDAVALLESAVIVDTVSYEGAVPGYTEGAAGAPAGTATVTESIARVPDGCDTDQNAADFKLVAGTPGAANGAGAGGPRYDYRQIDPLPRQRRRGAKRQHPHLVPVPHRRPRPALRRPAGRDRDDPHQAGRRPRRRAAHAQPRARRPGEPVFENSRKPLAGEFRYQGRPLFVVGNHFNSKGGDDPVFGRFQEPRRPSELVRRGSATDPDDTVRGQAGVLNAFVRDILDIDSRARVVVLGDFNDFDFSETLRVLEQGPSTRSGPELVNLWRLLPRAERYSYIFQGNAQVLDHILVSPSLLLRDSPDFDAVHINTECSDQASDHDPPIVRFELDG